MRVNGKWLTCDDGEIRPVVQGKVRSADQRWIEVTFLLDAGADRTVFSSQFLDLLRSLEVIEFEPTSLAGVGGRVSTISVETSIGFSRDDGRPISVQGTFRVFTESESADLSVLGRDVTNNFSVIYDYPNQNVALLAPPHYYEIK
ncbi:MAG: hypothetical protein ACRD82_11105 [Blastocatellia bacterium]